MLLVINYKILIRRIGNKNVKVPQHFLQVEDNSTISGVPVLAGGISGDRSGRNGRHVSHCSQRLPLKTGLENFTGEM